MSVPSTKSRERVARNFVRTYGRARFRRLIEALERGESGQEIANEFGVSRERVRQWKNTFGQVITLYQLHPEVERILREARPA
ncbi:MAG: helix-turn-helix domain-containing protein [Pseudomonadota bacterium]